MKEFGNGALVGGDWNLHQMHLSRYFELRECIPTTRTTNDDRDFVLRSAASDKHDELTIQSILVSNRRSCLTFVTPGSTSIAYLSSTEQQHLSTDRRYCSAEMLWENLMK